MRDNFHYDAPHLRPDMREPGGDPWFAVIAYAVAGLVAFGIVCAGLFLAGNWS